MISQNKSRNKRIAILGLLTIAAFASLLFTNPIAQDIAYHNFADIKNLYGLQNFWNVWSNLPFVIAGLIGLLRYPRLSYKESSVGYLVICVAIIFVGFGSAYYHADPSNQTLLWDRLPITIAFMALFSMLISERVLHKSRNILLFSLVTFGIGSALYWAWTESLGRGDLRLYALVQFLPIALIPLILLMFPKHYLDDKKLFLAFGFYIAAKLFEHFDSQIFTMLNVISGHSIKHILAAAAVLCVIYAVPSHSRSVSTQLIG